MLRINCLTHTVLGFKTNSTGMFPNWLAARSSSWFWVFSDTSTPEIWHTHHQDQRHKLTSTSVYVHSACHKIVWKNRKRKFYHSSFSSIDVLGDMHVVTMEGILKWSRTSKHHLHHNTKRKEANCSLKYDE